MKKLKRVVAILLMVVMLFSVGDVCSFAETDNGDFGYEGYFEGHRYQVFSDKVSTWEEAEKYCESLGGHLATITCKEENDYVYQLMINSGYQSAYFGLTDKDEEGKWKWVTEEIVSYTNWHLGEPNSENSNEDYAMFYYKFKDGTWNDGDFGKRTVNSGIAFICEWENVDKDYFQNINMDLFDFDIFLADCYLYNVTIRNVIKNMNSFEYPSQLLVDGLNDTSFQKKVNSWKLAHFVTSPSDIVEGGIDEKGYYEAIILSILMSRSQEDSLLSEIEKNVTSEVNSLLNDFSELVEKSDSLEAAKINKNQILMTIPIEEQKLIRDNFSDIFEKNHPQLDKYGKIASVINIVFSTSVTIQDAFELMTYYTKMCDLNAQQKAVIEEMYKLCPEDNYLFKNALSEVVSSLEGFESGLIKAISNATEVQQKKVLGVFIDEGWDAVVKSNPYFSAFIIGTKMGTVLGDMICNTLFSTDKTIEQYQKMKCLGEFSDLLHTVISNFGDEYRNDRTTQNAKKYVEAVKVMFSVASLSCDFAKEYGNVIYNDAMIGRFLKNFTDIESYFESVENLKKTYESNYEMIDGLCYAQLCPEEISLENLVADYKGFTVSWRNWQESITGYQIQYSTSKKFTLKTRKSKWITKNTRLSVRDLKSDTKYYVRIRAYRKINGKVYYSGWSAVESIKTK